LAGKTPVDLHSMEIQLAIPGPFLAGKSIQAWDATHAKELPGA